MINLSLDELKLIAQSRNISDYENKSEKDLVKALSKPKPKIRINKKKLEEIRKDFCELRHKLSKKEVDKYRKAFYDIKNYRHLSTSEIEEARKNLIELRKSLRFKKFHGDIDSVDYDDLDNYDDNYDFADDDEYRKIGSIRTLFKENEEHEKNEENDSDSDRAEWKSQLVMQNICISTKDFEETRTIYSACEPVDIFMGSDTKYVKICY